MLLTIPLLQTKLLKVFQQKFEWLGTEIVLQQLSAVLHEIHKLLPFTPSRPNWQATRSTIRILVVNERKVVSAGRAFSMVRKAVMEYLYEIAGMQGAENWCSVGPCADKRPKWEVRIVFLNDGQKDTA